MEITCSQCKQTWDVPAGQVLAAKLKFGLGAKEHTFVCPNCDAKNVILEDEFHAVNPSNQQIPVTGTQMETQTHARRPGGEAPVNPVQGPKPSIKHRGVVMAVFY